MTPKQMLEKKRPRLYVERVPINRGGYDRRGRYWGVGQRLYLVSDESGDIYEHVRAASAKDARHEVMKQKGFKPPRERIKVPRYRPHAFRKPEQVKKEYATYAKHHVKLARQADRAADEREKTRGKSDALVKQWRAEARRERALAKRGLAEAKRFRGVYSRDRSHRRSR